MNDFEPVNSPDDLLDRAIHAIKSEAAPAGPSAAVHAEALAALRRAGGNQNYGIIWRFITMAAFHRIAATIVVIIGGLAIWTLTAFFAAAPSISFAQVAERVHDARTLTYTATVDNGGITTVMKQLARGSVVRTEMPGDQVMIMTTDNAVSKTLTLNKVAKTAQLTEFRRDNAAPAVAGPAGDMLDGFRKLADLKGEPIEDREIHGIKAKGFSVKGLWGLWPASIWVEPATKLPLLIEVHATYAGKPVTTVMSDFVFDAPLDDALFSLQPPAGYAVTNLAATIHTDLQSNVVNRLKGYAELHDGQFPQHLDDVGEIAVGIVRHGGKPTQEDMDMATAAGAINAILASKQQGKDFDYIPGDARLGDSSKIVFWYQKDGTYHAVYGDLHCATVSRGELPGSK